MTPDRQAAPIGVFDSGIGGLSILRALRAELPHERFVYVADSAHAPYGERDEAHVVARSLALAGALHAEHGAKALVVACNTATAAAVHTVRSAYPGLVVVGVEPALKPAAEASRTRRIGVLATRGTLKSTKFAELHAALANKATFVAQPCDGLADAIESLPNSGDASKVIALLQNYTRTLGTFGSENGQIDTLVLGCTHYPLVADLVQAQVGATVQLIEPGIPVARHTRRRLAQAQLLAPAQPHSGQVQWFATGDTQALQCAALRWLDVKTAVVGTLIAPAAD